MLRAYTKRREMQRYRDTQQKQQQQHRQIKYLINSTPTKTVTIA